MAIQFTTINIIIQSFVNTTINLWLLIVPSVTTLLGWRSSLFERVKSVSIAQFTGSSRQCSWFHPRCDSKGKCSPSENVRKCPNIAAGYTHSWIWAAGCLSPGVAGCRLCRTLRWLVASRDARPVLVACGAQASLDTGILSGPGLLVCGLHKEGAGGCSVAGRRAEGRRGYQTVRHGIELLYNRMCFWGVLWNAGVGDMRQSSCWLRKCWGNMALAIIIHTLTQV